MDMSHLLSPEEIEVYEKIIGELEKNKEYYLTADPVEKTRTLIENCGVSEKQIYEVIKKITDYSEEEGNIR